MAGVRIRHGFRRNQMLPVPLLHKPFPAPHQCFACHTHHPCKVLHLNLDAEGVVIVSPEIWADLQRTAKCGGFTVQNQVIKPPAQTIHPPTIKLKLRGVDLAGTLAHTAPRAETFVPAGSRATTRDAQPAVRTVTVDEYVDVAARNKVDEAAALNLLLSKVLTEGPEVRGDTA